LYGRPSGPGEELSFLDLMASISSSGVIGEERELIEEGESLGM